MHHKTSFKTRVRTDGRTEKLANYLQQPSAYALRQGLTSSHNNSNREQFNYYEILAMHGNKTTCILVLMDSCTMITADHIVCDCEY